MKSKQIISKHFLTTFKKVRASFNVEYVVEAKPNRRWVRVGGPFSDPAAADSFAIQYSNDHAGVEVQVVVFQS